MAINSFEKLYEGDDLEGATLDVMYLRSPGGTLKNIYVYAGGNVIGADAVFNLTKNGAALWSGADRLQIPEDSASGAKTDLSVETTRGDIFFLDLEECGEGGISSPLTLILEFDDGTTGGLSVEEVQDIVGAMLVAGSHSMITYDDEAGTVTVNSIQLSDEEIQDKVGAFISGGANTTVTYNDGANTLTIAETAAGKTQEEIEDIVAGLLSQGANITLTYDDAGNALTIAATGGGGGASLPAGDLNAATNTLEYLQRRGLNIPGDFIFAEDFNANAIDPAKFVISNPSSLITIQNVSSRLEMAFPVSNGTNPANKITTVDSYDFRDKQIEVDIIAFPVGGAMESYFYLRVDANNYAFLFHEGGNLYSRVVKAGAAANGGYAASPGETKWRFRHLASTNTLYLEKYVSGVWSAQQTFANCFDVSAVKFSFEADAYSTTPATTQKFIVDNLTSNVGSSLADNSLLWFKTGADEYQVGNLADVKDAMDALETFTTGGVFFAKPEGDKTVDDTNLHWDNTNKRLGIGTNSPDYKLEVNSTNNSTTKLRKTVAGGKVLILDFVNSAEFTKWLSFTTNDETYTYGVVANASYALSLQAQFNIELIPANIGEVSGQGAVNIGFSNTSYINSHVMNVKPQANGQAGINVVGNSSSQTADLQNWSQFVSNVVGSTALAYTVLSGVRANGNIYVPADAYNESSWNNNTDVPQKAALRNALERIERLVDLTDAATISVDAALGNFFSVTLAGNRTLANPVNMKPGKEYTFEFIQDGTGGRAITLDTMFTFGTDVTSVVLSTAAGKRDFMKCIYRNSKLYIISFVRGY